MISSEPEATYPAMKPQAQIPKRLPLGTRVPEGKPLGPQGRHLLPPRCKGPEILVEHHEQVVEPALTQPLVLEGGGVGRD